jgi:hypothetical protein
MISEPGEIKVDYRICGLTRYCFASEQRKLMKIPEEIRKCVAFLEYRNCSGFHFAGTVFFVTFQSVNQPNYFFRYAVTARHVINEIKERTNDCHVYFRLNNRDNGTCQVRSSISEWLIHPCDDFVDVAVMPISFQECIEWMFWDVQGFATDENIRKNEINVGDDVFLTGLYHRHTGKERNVPIIRAGIISAMPEEPVNTGLGEAESYLIETKSINGLSGSPVFVRPESNCAYDSKTEDPHTLGHRDARVGSFWLLGLMHGHWDVKTSDRDKKKTKTHKSYTESINEGIGIVVPAQKILEVIKHPDSEKMRNRIEAQLQRQEAATVDGLIEN